MAIRKQAVDSGHWPPPQGESESKYGLIAQENKILLAAAFSPLQ